MRTRAVLLVAVVGALLVGGATTGTTLASWRDQAGAASGSVASGSMALTAASTPATLSVARGTTGTTLVTVSDASSAQAKNLVQRLTPTVTGTLPSGVSATLTTRSGSTCTSTVQGAVTTGPSGSFVTCLNVSVASGATATSATVTVSVAGRQLRGGTPAGWTATDRTVTVPVTVFTAPPVISCLWQGGSLYVTWATAAGTTYTGYYATSQAGPYTSFGAVTAPLPMTVSPNSSFYVRVTASAGGQPSGYSNTLLLARGQGGQSTPTCTPVTP
jgi:hypothetical protein